MTSSEGFPAVDAEKELHPGKNKGVEVDPISSEVATTKEIKEQAEERKKQDEEIKKQKDEQRRKQAEERKECIQKFKTTVIISGIIAAGVGAIFEIANKLKQK